MGVKKPDLMRRRALADLAQHQQDYTEAMHWYREAAEQNYGDAENNIGWLYQKGLGVEQDSAEAITWYRESGRPR